MRLDYSVNTEIPEKDLDVTNNNDLIADLQSNNSDENQQIQSIQSPVQGIDTTQSNVMPK